MAAMNRIPRPKIVVAIVAAVVLAVGLGVTGTVAASRALTADDERRAVLDDAADRLDVEPSELEDALRDALKARVDTAVEEGRLTEEQGVELKTRIDSGEMQFLRGLGKPGPGRFGHFHHFARFPALRAAAEYLGLAEEELRERLREATRSRRWRRPRARPSTASSTRSSPTRRSVSTMPLPRASSHRRRRTSSPIVCITA